MPTSEPVSAYLARSVYNTHRMLQVCFEDHQGDAAPYAFLALRLEFTESLSTPFRAVVHGVCPEEWRSPRGDDPDAPGTSAHPHRFLKRAAGIVVTAEGRTRRIHGVVTAVRHLGDWYSKTDEETSHVFELVIESPLRLFDLRKDNRIFPNIGSLQVVRQLIFEHRCANDLFARTLVQDMFGRDHDHPDDVMRPTITQYQETDLDFIHRQLIDTGTHYVLDPDIPGYDSSRSRPRGELSSTLKLLAPGHDFGKDPDAVIHTSPAPGQLALLAWRGCVKTAASRSSATSHDYQRNAHFRGVADTAVTNTTRHDDAQTSFVPGKFGWNESIVPEAIWDITTGMGRPANVRQWAHDLDAEVFEGQTTGPLSVGKVIRVLGLDAPRVSLGATHDDYVVTAQTIIATATVVPFIREQLARLAADVRGRDGTDLFPADLMDESSLVVRFEAQPKGKALVPKHPSDAKRPMPGPVTATVVGHPDKVLDTDELGRICVRFHWERSHDVRQDLVNAQPSEYPSIRLRYVHPGAGQNMGMQCLPRIGDEVLIVFLDNDPDKPIAVGSIHNSAMGTPSFGGVSVLPQDVALTGMRTLEYKGAGSNEFVMDDTHSEVGMHLSTSTAATDFNLGDIRTPRARGTARPRGTGAELRTDGAAAIRATEGVLLSTCAAVKDAIHMSHDDLKDLMARCNELTRVLGEAVARAGAHSTIPNGQAELRNSLDTWCTVRNSETDEVAREPVVAIHGTAGLVTATEASHVAYAGKDMHLAAEGGVHHASGGEFFLTSGHQLTLFAAHDGIDVITAEGNLRLQSHEHDVIADAQRHVQIMANEGRVQITGLEIEIIAHDGSYLRIGKGIELGTAEKVFVRAADLLVEDPATLTTVKTAHAKQDTDQVFRARYANDPEGPNAAPGRALHVASDAGDTHSFISDEGGMTRVIADTAIRALRATVLDTPL